jgi:hypothetical protein
MGTHALLVPFTSLGPPSGTDHPGGGLPEHVLCPTVRCPYERCLGAGCECSVCACRVCGARAERAARPALAFADGTGGAVSGSVRKRGEC